MNAQNAIDFVNQKSNLLSLKQLAKADMKDQSMGSINNLQGNLSSFKLDSLSNNILTTPITENAFLSDQMTVSMDQADNLKQDTSIDSYAASMLLSISAKNTPLTVHRHDLNTSDLPTKKRKYQQTFDFQQLSTGSLGNVYFGQQLSKSDSMQSLVAAALPYDQSAEVATSDALQSQSTNVQHIHSTAKGQMEHYRVREIVEPPVQIHIRTAPGIDEARLQLAFKNIELMNCQLPAIQIQQQVLNRPGVSFQAAKQVDDLYTPRFVRGSGNNREGLCLQCFEPNWLKIKVSSYWQHMHWQHGISSATKQRMPLPVSDRELQQGKYEVQCGHCQQWIQATRMSQNQSDGLDLTHFYKHSQKCLKSSNNHSS